MGSHKYLISVIMPVYNGEKYLSQALNSIRHQTYSNLEIIVVDDGSTDSSYKICKEMVEQDPRIKLIHQDNNGVASARNTGLSAATGDYIVWVDSDDYIYETYIQSLLEKLEEYQVQALIIQRTEEGQPYVLEKNEILKSYFLEDISGCLWCTFFNRKYYYGKQFENFKIGEDAIMIFRILCELDRVLCVQSRDYFYREQENSIVHSLNDIKILSWIQAVKVQVNEALKRYPECSPYVAYKVMRFSIASYLVCNTQEVRDILTHFMLTNIFRIRLYKLPRKCRKKLLCYCMWHIKFRLKLWIRSTLKKGKSK